MCLSEESKSVNRPVLDQQLFETVAVPLPSTCPSLLLCHFQNSRHRRCTVPDRESRRRSRNPAIATALELIAAVQNPCLLDGGEKVKVVMRREPNSDAFKLAFKWHATLNSICREFDCKMRLYLKTHFTSFLFSLFWCIMSNWVDWNWKEEELYLLPVWIISSCVSNNKRGYCWWGLTQRR